MSWSSSLRATARRAARWRLARRRTLRWWVVYGPDLRFTYQGSTADDLVTPEMVDAFERVTGLVRARSR